MSEKILYHRDTNKEGNMWLIKIFFLEAKLHQLVPLDKLHI